MKLNRLFLSGLAAITVISSAAITASANTLITESVYVTQEAAAVNGVNVNYRTQDQIRSYIAAHPFTTTGSVTFTKSPDLTSPYTDPGDISDASRKNGLNALNVIRYIAGVGEVTLNSDYNMKAQYGAYIDALNGSISHFPEKPPGVSDSIYDIGYAANGASNLAAGFSNLGTAILGYMDDSDDNNIANLGHRRWCINPPMQQTGFGQVNTTSGYRYYSNMYSMDNASASWNYTDITGVVWPAQNMPTEYFGANQAWSYSLGEKISDASAVSVTLTRKSDGRVWKFSNSSKDGYFRVDQNTSSTYGQPGCVIFRPSNVGSYSAGDVFTVHIDGLKTPVDYTVNFFAIDVTPTAVTGFKAKPSSDSIYLSWDKNSTADSYQIDIYRNGKWEYLIDTSATSCNVTGLKANTSYQFRIFAFNGKKYSDSTKLTVSTTAASTPVKPTAVTGFSASPSTNSVALSWNKNSTADSYQIDIYKNGKWTYLTTTSGTSYTATGLTANTSYQFRIFAFKGSEYSTSVSLTVSTKSAASAKPTAVTGFSASPSTNSVALTWNKNSTADSYQIDIYKNGKWTYLTTTSGTSYTATGLAANTSYQFRIFAFKGSEYSTSVSLTVSTKSAASAKPTAVTGFSASPSTNSVALSWNKNSTADSYQIDIYKNGKWTYLTTTTGTSYTATGLTANTSYQFRIFAFKGSAYSTSAKVTVSTKAAAASSSSKPTAVTGFSASPSTNSVALSWNKNITADSYQIDIYKNGKWTYLTTTTGTSYTATGLTANTSYQFRIFAFKGSAYSTSAKLTAATKASGSAKPAVVTNFNASPSLNSIKLTWSKSANADSYQIDVYKNGKWTYLTKTSGTSYTATGLDSGTEYRFRIFAFSGSIYSSAMHLTAATKPAAVTGLTAAPTSKSIQLSWRVSTGADSYQIDKYENGRWVYVGTTTGTSYNVTGLSSGYSYNFRVFAFKGSEYSSSTKITAFTL